MPNKPDILYILRDRVSKWSDNELRFSLRSLANVPHGRVFIATGRELPEWLQNVEHVQAADGYENKLANAVFKIRSACRDPKLSEKFVLMNDDFFFLRPVQRIEGYTLGTLSWMMDDHKTKAGYYFEAMRQTHKLLVGAGMTNPMSYEVHYPLEMEKEKFLAMTDPLQWDERGYLFRSIYGNTYAIGNRKRADTKAFSTEQILKHEDLLSISDRVAMYPKFQKYIFVKFPAECEYEKPGTGPALLP